MVENIMSKFIEIGFTPEWSKIAKSKKLQDKVISYCSSYSVYGVIEDYKFFWIAPPKEQNISLVIDEANLCESGIPKDKIEEFIQNIKGFISGLEEGVKFHK
jgi:hypothetical protein